MRAFYGGLVWALWAVMTAQAQEKPSAANADEETAIRQTLHAFSAAFERGEARSIANLFVEDGEAVDLEGVSLQGRAALERHYAERIADNPGGKLAFTLNTFKLLAPGVARIQGTTSLTSSQAEAPVSGRFSAIMLKRDGGWLAASVRELPELDLTCHDHLKEIAWLVGDWVEESPEAVITTTIAWTEDQNFLRRTYTVKVQGKAEISGVQRIGWDPLTRQFKSRTFDSTGGHGEAFWTRAGDSWVIKARGVRSDGQVTSATQILTRVNQDTLRWRSTDRTLGGEISDDIQEVTMIRRPPQPAR